MAYTYKTLTLAWLTVFGFVALSGSGMVAGSGVLLLAGAALVMPALILTLRSKPRSTVGAIAPSYERALATPAARGRSPADLSDSGDRWENEGGARP